MWLKLVKDKSEPQNDGYVNADIATAVEIQNNRTGSVYGPNGMLGNVWNEECDKLSAIVQAGNGWVAVGTDKNGSIRYINIMKASKIEFVEKEVQIYKDGPNPTYTFKEPPIVAAVKNALAR